MNDSDWTTVHAAPPWEVEMLAGMLEDEGIPSRQPDELPSAVDPLVHPTAGVSVRLQVRTEDATRANDLIAAHRAAGSGDEDEDEYEMTGQEEVEYLARWVRRASFFVVGLVFVPWLMPAYRRACREHGTQSGQHRLTVAAPWLAAAAVLVAVFAFGYLPRWLPDSSPPAHESTWPPPPPRPPPPPPPPPPPILPR